MSRGYMSLAEVLVPMDITIDMEEIGVPKELIPKIKAWYKENVLDEIDDYEKYLKEEKAKKQ